MFTGLIEETGRLRQSTQKGPGMTLLIEASASFVAELSLGESVAIDGACMTVTGTESNSFSFDASAESMRRTTLGKKRIGDPVHLERALRLGDRLGGHMVSGHVDGLGTLVERRQVGEGWVLRFKMAPSLLPFIIEKGSIAIDGVSLTINELFDDGLNIMLIPHSQSIVDLHNKAIGDSVNLEVDQIGKYVQRMLGLSNGGKTGVAGTLTKDRLRELGFLS